MRYFICITLVLTSSLASAKIPDHERHAMRRVAALLWPEAASDQPKLDALIDQMAGSYDGRDEEDRITRMQMLASDVVEAIERAGQTGATADDLRTVIKGVLRAHQLDVARGRRAANAVTARVMLGLAAALTVGSAVDLAYLVATHFEGVQPLFIALTAPVPPLFLAGFFYAYGDEYPRVVPGSDAIGRRLDRYKYLRDFEVVLDRAFRNLPTWVDATSEGEASSKNIVNGISALIAERWGDATRVSVCESMFTPPRTLESVQVL